MFTQKPLGDVPFFPARGLADTEVVARGNGRRLGASPTVVATLDRRAVLDGADVVMTMFQVGGWKPATVTGFAIPAGYRPGRTGQVARLAFGRERSPE